MFLDFWYVERTDFFVERSDYWMERSAGRGTIKLWNELTGYHWSKTFVRKYFGKVFFHSISSILAILAKHLLQWKLWREVLLVERTLIPSSGHLWHVGLLQCALCALMHCVSFARWFYRYTKILANDINFCRPFKALRPSSMVVTKVCFPRSFAIDSANAKFDVWTYTGIAKASYL